MRVLLIAILFLLLLVSVVAAEPNRNYWSDTNQYQLNKGDHIELRGYNVSLSDWVENSPGQYTLFMTVSKQGEPDNYFVINQSDTIFLDDNRVQLNYIRTDFSGKQVFVFWEEKIPDLLLVADINRTQSEMEYNATFTLKNANGKLIGPASNIVVKLTPPLGCTLSTSNTIFSGIELLPTGEKATTFKVSTTNEMINRSIVVNVDYKYVGGEESDSFSNLVSLPSNNTVQSVVTTLTRTQSNSVSTSVAPATTGNGTTVTNSTLSTTTTTTSSSKKPRVVKFRATPAPTPTPEPVVTPQQTNSEPLLPDLGAPTIPKPSDFSKNEKGALLVYTLLIGWFIIYKL